MLVVVTTFFTELKKKKLVRLSNDDRTYGGAGVKHGGNGRVPVLLSGVVNHV